MFILTALLSVVMSSSSALAAPETAGYCKRQEANSLHQELLVKLAERLSYTKEELCQHPRILDIFFEDRLVHNRATDQYEDFKFITIHYNEYSCQYSYGLESQAWGKQHCYNTF